jgi:TPR repeat protein
VAACNAKTIGVSAQQINAPLAIRACEAAVREYPNDNRFAFQLGRAYESANNFEAAVAPLRKAAEQGYAAAQYTLGLMYNNGQGVPQDFTQAAAWYRKAAEQGLAPAQANLGTLYVNGQGVSRDYAEAIAWFRKAAEQGNAEGKHNLGVMYFNGQGVPQDADQGQAWLDKADEQKKAAQQGDQEAIANLSQLGYEEAQRKRNELRYKEQKRKGATAAVAALDAGRTMKLPNMWAYQGAMMEEYPPYFKCNYTTKSCLRGKAVGNAFIGEVLAEDRQTVVDHIMCHGEDCINFDTGLETMNGRVVGSPRDTSYACIEVLRDLGEICDLRPVAIGSSWMISPGVIRCKERSWNYSGPGCHSGNYETVVVDKVDNGAQACVHVEGRHDCFWVNKNNLSGPLQDR